MKNICLFTFFLFSILNFAQEISDSLLLNYKFDNDFLDSSGNEFDGENYGATFTEDRFGRTDSAVYFNGIDNYILFPNLEELKPELPVSFSFWVKYDSMDGDFGYLLSTSFEQDRSSGIYFNTQMSTGKYAVNYGDGTYFFNPSTRRTYISEKVIDTIDWHHIAVIVNSELDMKIYVDCKEHGGQYVGSGGDLVYSENAGNLGRGRRNVNAGINYFKGTLDDFYYWNRELSEDEISTLCEKEQMSTQDFTYQIFKVVPNPVLNKLILKADFNDIDHVIIYDSTGKTVYKEKFIKETIDVSELNSGIYYINIIGKNRFDSVKFIKN